MKAYYTRFNTPLFEMLLAGNEKGLTQSFLITGQGKRSLRIDPDWVRDDTFFNTHKAQIEAYFAGERRAFDLPLHLEGTAFQQSVWTYLQTIPFGETRSYQEIANALGKPKSVRAVGAANGKNPIAIIIRSQKPTQI